MLVTGIVLLILGGCVAYFGRPREQLLFYAGVIIFLIGVVFLVLWLVAQGDANTDLDVALFGPLAYALRKMADKIDNQTTAVIPPGNFVFWSWAPTPSHSQWALHSSYEGQAPDGTTYRVNVN